MKRLAASVIFFAFGIVFFLEMMWRSLNPYGGFTICNNFRSLRGRPCPGDGNLVLFRDKEVLPKRVTVDRALLHSLRSVPRAPSP